MLDVTGSLDREAVRLERVGVRRRTTSVARPSHIVLWGPRGEQPSKPTLFNGLASDQAGIPAELKHINKRRKRNQPGLPQ